MAKQEIKPTSIDDLVKYSKGVLIELPEFGDGQKFYARLKRPSMLMLMKNGKIPNTLLVSANELFAKGTGAVEVEDENSFKEVTEIMEIIIEASLVEPTYEELKQAGVELTDAQMMAIFSYSQNGIKAVESFR